MDQVASQMHEDLVNQASATSKEAGDVTRVAGGDSIEDALDDVARIEWRCVVLGLVLGEVELGDGALGGERYHATHELAENQLEVLRNQARDRDVAKDRFEVGLEALERRRRGGARRRGIVERIAEGEDVGELAVHQRVGRVAQELRECMHGARGLQRDELRQNERHVLVVKVERSRHVVQRERKVGRDALATSDPFSDQMQQMLLHEARRGLEAVAQRNAAEDRGHQGTQLGVRVAQTEVRHAPALDRLAASGNLAESHECRGVALEARVGHRCELVLQHGPNKVLEHALGLLELCDNEGNLAAHALANGKVRVTQVLDERIIQACKLLLELMPQKLSTTTTTIEAKTER